MECVQWEGRVQPERSVRVVQEEEDLITPLNVLQAHNCVPPIQVAMETNSHQRWIQEQHILLSLTPPSKSFGQTGCWTKVMSDSAPTQGNPLKLWTLTIAVKYPETGTWTAPRCGEGDWHNWSTISWNGNKSILSNQVHWNHEAVFQEDLGALEGYQATIMMGSIHSLCLPGTGWEKTWPPCFWRNSGTCWVSEWASPIVPVLKSDSKYVVTSNRLLILSPFLTTHSSRESEDSCEGPTPCNLENLF